MKTKKIIFLSSVFFLLSYILLVFYLSEPKYIDNNYKIIEKYDYVSIPHDGYDREVQNGIILRVDKETALLKITHYKDKFYELNLSTDKYRIVGRGTIYHKVNEYVGFNIMFITQIFVGLLCAIIIGTSASTLSDLLNSIK